MSSKRNVKVNKCKHVFKQGLKSGKKCNRNCRGDYCKDHNKNRKEYNKKIYDEKVIEQKSDIDAKAKALLRRINKAKCKEDLPDKTKMLIKSKSVHDKCKVIVNRIKALKILSKEITEDDILSKDGNLVLDKVRREMAHYEKRRIRLKNGKTKTKKRVLSDEDIKREKEKIIRKRPRLIEELRLWRKIEAAYQSKENKFGIEHSTIKELEEMEEADDIKKPKIENQYQSKIEELTNIANYVVKQNCDYGSSKITEQQKNGLIDITHGLLRQCAEFIDEWKGNKKLKFYWEMVKSINDNINDVLRSIENIETINESSESEEEVIEI